MNELQKQFEKNTGNKAIPRIGKHFYDDINNYVAWLESKLTWRRVDGELPIVGQIVFAKENNIVYKAYYCHTENEWTCVHLDKVLKATHWLPLPE